MLSIRLGLLLASVAVTALAPTLGAQGGYTSEKYPQHGLKFELARDYEWLAVQPNEKWVILQWADTGRSPVKGKQVGGSSKLQIVRIDYISDPGPSTPSSGPRLPREEEGEPKKTPGKEKAKPKPLPINRWSRYLDQKLSAWNAVKAREGKPRNGYSATEYELTPKKFGSGIKRWAYVWENDSVRSFVVLGSTRTEEFEEQSKIWRHIAEKMRFSEPVPDPEAIKWERFYRRRPKYKQPDYRIRVRTGLEGDWKAEDTPNYIVIFNTKDQPLVRSVVADLESIRKEYVRLFPPVGEIDAVSTVRICHDRDEYMRYGGPRGSAGYWYFVTEELVLYDGTKRQKGKATDKLNTFIVLYHEAFHQFIYYSVGSVAPHSWFNEGYGDYFSGAQIKGGKVKRIGPNRWRLALIQKTILENKHVPWPKMIRYEKSQYYGPRASYYYAQGWSMVYFLNESKVARRHPLWSTILTRYFEELKVAWALEQDGLPKGDSKAKGEAQKRARERATQVAFEGVDLAELEEEWAAFTLTLKL